MPSREVTLAAPPAFHLPPLDDAGNAWVAGEEMKQHLESLYVDTLDLRLARWGCSLRHRSDEGWTLRLPSPERDEAAPGDRGPLRFEGSAGHPPEAATALVQAYARRAPLQPMARLSTRRRRVVVSDEAGEPLLTVVDDEVSVLQGRRVAARFQELGVTLPDGAPVDSPVLRSIVARLGAAGAVVTGAIPGHVRALGPLASVPEVKVPPLSPEPSAAEVVRAAIATSVVTLLRRDPGVRLGGDPEDVHQARVALRHLRSNLRTFAALLEPEWARAVREEAGWLAGELGGVRDREVLLARLEGKAAGLETADRRAAGGLTRQLAAELGEARAELDAAISSDRYLDAVELLIGAARQPRFTEAAADPAADVLPLLVRKPWRALRRGVQSLPDEPPDAALHRLRILAKRTRYAAEAAAPVVGPPAMLFARRVAGLQSVLGEHQDSVVARVWIRETAGTGRQAFVAGVLYGLEQADGDRARSEWPGAWDRLSGRKLRSWMG
ncbi:MAG: CHAD domain-containing protein [Candidatus Dormibacteraceae bacterium]